MAKFEEAPTIIRNLRHSCTLETVKKQTKLVYIYPFIFNFFCRLFTILSACVFLNEARSNL